jgi:hypothetical protein
VPILTFKPGSERGSPLVIDLPTGDRVSATEGARFRVVELERGRRTVAVDRGTVLFEVRHLADGERFQVRSGSVRVRVRGTVFTVERTGANVVVSVFEDRVEATDGPRRWNLGAGERLAASRVGALDPSAALGREAAVAAAERSPEPAPADPPLTAGTSAPTNRGSMSIGPDRAEIPTRTASRDHVGRDRDPDLAEARRLLAAGESTTALAAVRRRDGGPWRLVEADALRALDRHASAAAAYDRAAPALSGSERVQAGYLAATTRRDQLDDASGALASLDRSAAAASGSPLEERALVLRVDLLTALMRHPEATATAERYLARFPAGGHAPTLRVLLATHAR